MRFALSFFKFMTLCFTACNWFCNLSLTSFKLLEIKFIFGLLENERNINITISHIGVKRELEPLYKSRGPLLSPVGFRMEP